MTALSDEEQSQLCELMTVIGEMMFGYGNYTGCDINVKTSLGDTPLHSAVILGDENAVSLLIKAGSDINAKGEDGYTPLLEAVQQGNPRMVALLLETGADIHAKNDDGDDALELSKSNRDIYELLKKHDNAGG